MDIGAVSKSYSKPFKGPTNSKRKLERSTKRWPSRSSQPPRPLSRLCRSMASKKGAFSKVELVVVKSTLKQRKKGL